MITYPTYADVFRPTEKQTALWYDLALIVAGSLLVALSAQLAFYLPFSPVPVTGQTFAVLLVGLVLGSKRGSASMVTYLLEGAVGLPVFAQGASGLATFAGPTAGYLLGFVAAAFVVGFLAEKGWDRSPWLTAAAMILGNLVIYLFGLPWLGWLFGFDKMLTFGFWPYLPGDVFKIALAMISLPTAWKLVGKEHNLPTK